MTITPQRLGELDALYQATREEPIWSEEETHYANIDTLTTSIPELTAEIRRCWAELQKSDQLGMVDLLRESRRLGCK